jgi:hypothetical protein
MNIREDVIYARQSVDRKDSISIESQIDFCKYELKGGSCRVFKDKGYSGKNTDRPEFQKLLGEIRKGKVRRVVVYKLDRISRSILDFANMMELFQEYDVEFVSSTEKFDTSTPMGRAMLNICIVFAQLERETIQKRVTDAYTSWERPQNERHNGLFRTFVPKGVSIEAFSVEYILAAADELNGRPRKKLGYRTPEELFDEFLDSVYAAEGCGSIAQDGSQRLPS